VRAAGEESGESARLERENKQEFRLVRTNGEALLWTAVLGVGPFVAKAALEAAGVPDLDAGKWVGFVMVMLLFVWTATYFVRVATKDMTYAKQLRSYEDEVLQKRYAELSDEEIAALAEELDPPKRNK